MSSYLSVAKNVNSCELSAVAEAELIDELASRNKDLLERCASERSVVKYLEIRWEFDSAQLIASGKCILANLGQTSRLEVEILKIQKIAVSCIFLCSNKETDFALEVE